MVKCSMWHAELSNKLKRLGATGLGGWVTYIICTYYANSTNFGWVRCIKHSCIYNEITIAICR